MRYNDSAMNLMNQKNNENDSSYSTPFSSSPTTTDTDTTKTPPRSSIGEVIRFAVMVLIIVIPLRIFIAKPFIVNGASMDPTFATGQYLIIDQVSYYFQEPARGDVIVFRYPLDTKKYFIKRIIGLPGETIALKNGKVFVKNRKNPDGMLLDEPYLTAHSFDTSEEVLLSPGEYFVMGDNRPASSDSRIWGPLEKGYITGRPLVRLTPLSQASFWPGANHFKEGTDDSTEQKK